MYICSCQYWAIRSVCMFVHSPCWYTRGYINISWSLPCEQTHHLVTHHTLLSQIWTHPIGLPNVPPSQLSWQSYSSSVFMSIHHLIFTFSWIMKIQFEIPLQKGTKGWCSLVVKHNVKLLLKLYSYHFSINIFTLTLCIEIITEKFIWISEEKLVMRISNIFRPHIVFRTGTSNWWRRPAEADQGNPSSTSKLFVAHCLLAH